MKIVVTHSSSLDFVKKLYEPLQCSELWQQHEFLLPQESGMKEQITKEIIAKADLDIAEVSLPSTGQGIELGWADAAGIPIICIYASGENFSSSVNYVAQDFLEYSNSDDMIAKLESFLQTFRK